MRTGGHSRLLAQSFMPLSISTLPIRRSVHPCKNSLTCFSVPVKKDWPGYCYCWLISARKARAKGRVRRSFSFMFDWPRSVPHLLPNLFRYAIVVEILMGAVRKKCKGCRAAQVSDRLLQETCWLIEIVVVVSAYIQMDPPANLGSQFPPMPAENTRNVIFRPGFGYFGIYLAGDAIEESHRTAVCTARAENGFERTQLTSIFSKDELPACVIFHRNLIALHTHDDSS